MVAVNAATCTVVSCALHLRMPARVSDIDQNAVMKTMRLMQCREATMVADDIAPCTVISCALHLRQQCHVMRAAEIMAALVSQMQPISSVGCHAYTGHCIEFEMLSTNQR